MDFTCVTFNIHFHPSSVLCSSLKSTRSALCCCHSLHFIGYTGKPVLFEFEFRLIPSSKNSFQIFSNNHREGGTSNASALTAVN
jgi:hypothetical protein